MLITRIACAMLGASCALPFAAHATLGQNASTVDADQSRQHALARVETTQRAYSVQQLTLPSGTVVREYVGANGVVFGVAWDGPTLPDLKSMLGASFDAYVAANASRRGAPLAISSDELVVFSGGHLRAFTGYAYLPRAVPAGVDVSVIQ
ncbi:DUF2844 domain-containing protein [Paraburkholderia sp. MMS20-SJTR3]|uniref:DUF2844 domain-containing protein n=1 Tax=Paraburkholderia sejongensis TaxID=2886946 RepID=A0ABS8JSW1_9BURK|nr:DUF2844 domain-containing protein [Paraburkholderia sp. MMS20-SJTR3]MCC8392990.1 DUF2844 domain-containing protein [Paraburkholderia sp. MMS20-SJTR3]